MRKDGKEQGVTPDETPQLIKTPISIFLNDKDLFYSVDDMKLLFSDNTEIKEDSDLYVTEITDKFLSLEHEVFRDRQQGAFYSYASIQYY